MEVKELSKNKKTTKERTQRIEWIQWLNIIEVLSAAILGWFFGWGWFALILLIFVRATTVAEGTAKIIMRFGAVVKVFIQWSGYKLDEEGNVVPTGEKVPKRPWYGGLRIWVGTPFDKVYKYNLRYHSIEEVEGKRIPVYHAKEEEDKADYVMIRPDRYWRKTTQLETRDGQFPDVEWQIGMRSENPEKTIFKAPHNWVENALNELEPSLRSFARTKDLITFLNLTRTQIWNEMENDHAVILLRKEWGIKIDENEIAIFDVTPPPGYQEALAAESKAKMEAKARKTRAKVEAVGRAAEIMGTVIQSLVESTGMPKKKIQEEFKKDPKAFYEKHKPIIDNAMTKLSMEERAYLRIETPGAEGALGDFLRLIGAWRRMPMGRGPKEEKLPAEKRKKGGKPETIETEVTKEDVEKSRIDFYNLLGKSKKR